MKTHVIATLLTASTLALTAAASAQTTRPTTNPAGPSSRMSSDQMLNQLLAPPPPNSAASPGKVIQASNELPAVDKTSGAGAVKPNAPVVHVLREGTIIPDRIGRLTRSPDGTQSQLSFDVDGTAMKDPPMILIPNSLLAAMEGAVSASNRDLKFRVTGTVTEYRGRNYLLLQKVVVVPDVIQSQF